MMPAGTNGEKARVRAVRDHQRHQKRADAGAPGDRHGEWRNQCDRTNDG